MPYKIFKFVTPNAKYQRERFTFKCLKFDLEIDLSRLPLISVYISLFKVDRNWKRVVRRHVTIGVPSKSCGI